jgi:hypothetical protein
MNTQKFLAGRIRFRAFALLLSLVGACAGNQILALDARYDWTRLPRHFDRDPAKNRSQIALSVGGHEAHAFALLRADSGRFTVRNATASGDASLLFEKGRSHFGLAVGISGDHGLPRMGAFWGYGAGLGPLRASVTGGLMMNNTWNDVHYNYVETGWVWIFPVAGAVREDSSKGMKGRLEIPLQAALLFDTGTPLSPFLAASMSKVLIGTGDGGENVLVRELAGGVEWTLPYGNRIRFEASAMKLKIDVGPALGETESPLRLGARVAYAKQF